MLNTVKPIRYTSRLLLSLLLVVTLLALDLQSVAACSCVGGLPFIEHVMGADAIFSGKVIKQEVATTADSYGIYPLLSTFAVEKVWKGAAQQTVAVATHEGNTCAYFFEVAQEYLIFSHAIEGQLYAGKCGRIQPLATADHDIALLDSIFAPALLLDLHPSASVTVHGYTTAIAEADQVAVRFIMERERATETTGATGEKPDFQQQREQLIEALRRNGLSSALLASAQLYSDDKDFYLNSRHDQLPEYDLAAFLQQLTQMQHTLAQDSRLPIHKIEVMFSLGDCTMP